MAQTGIRSLVVHIVAFIVALSTGLLASLPVAALGLAVPYVPIPLAIGFGALVAALAGAWVGMLAEPPGTRSRLLPIVGAAEAAAVVVAIVVVVMRRIPSGAAIANLFTVLLVAMTVIAMVVTSAVSRYRAPGMDLRRDLLITVGLILGGIVTIVATVGITCTATTCQA